MFIMLLCGFVKNLPKKMTHAAKPLTGLLFLIQLSWNDHMEEWIERQFTDCARI